MNQFFSKNKVFITGLMGAIIMGLLPVLQPGMPTPASIAAIVMAALTAVSSFLGKNLRGASQSISGIVFSVLFMVVPVYFSHGRLDMQNLTYVVLSQVASQFFGYSMPPFKPGSYEDHPVITEAKQPVN